MPIQKFICSPRPTFTEAADLWAGAQDVMRTRSGMGRDQQVYAPRNSSVPALSGRRSDANHIIAGNRGNT